MCVYYFKGHVFFANYMVELDGCICFLKKISLSSFVLYVNPASNWHELRINAINNKIGYDTPIIHCISINDADKDEKCRI